MMQGLAFSELSVGMSAQYSKTVREDEIAFFAKATGDVNPVHLDDDYAKTTIFGGRVAHGMLSAGFISALLGTRFPGPGTIYLEQTLKFHAPVRIGNTITIKATITRLIPEKRRVVMQTVCLDQQGKEIVSGEATVLVPKLER